MFFVCVSVGKKFESRLEQAVRGLEIWPKLAEIQVEASKQIAHTISSLLSLFEVTRKEVEVLSEEVKVLSAKNKELSEGVEKLSQKVDYLTTCLFDSEEQKKLNDEKNKKLAICGALCGAIFVLSV